MIGRKNMGRASPLLLVLLALGFFFATYNLVTMVIHNRRLGSGGWLGNNPENRMLVDPIIGIPDNLKRLNRAKVPFHVALTATDAPYSKWQCRIMYYWYKKQKDLPGSDFGGFTRILHSGRSDDLMEEIPTFVVDPLPAGLDRVSAFLDIFMLFIGYYFLIFVMVITVVILDLGRDFIAST